MKHSLILIFYINIFWSCSEKKGVKPIEKIDYAKQKTVIPSSLRSYVDTFVEEGKKRGVSIDLENSHFVMDFADLTPRNIAGIADYQTRKITIDDNFKDWSENEKQFVVFHELGHLLLDRQQHDDGIMENGEANSIMHSRSKCAGPIFFGKDRYNYYLDKLFKPLETQQPAWAKLGKYQSSTNLDKILYKSDFNIISESWIQKQGVNKFSVSTDGNLKIEMVNANSFDLSEMLPEFKNFAFENYEIRYKYKLYDAHLNVFWGVTKANSTFAVENPDTYAMIARYSESKICTDIPNFSFGKLNLKEFNVSASVKHKLNDWNELVYRVKEDRIWVFLNGDLFFQSDYERLSPTLNPTLRLVYGVGKYEIEYINIYEI